ncbi:HPP family protein [Spongiactinospora rosea]|uniref:HPP family protein n=1 Tax=Spongiactinospora rosea TaxID=2248750 RepID=UPI0018F5BE0F|nr:HPP family protein [Spongiactinospora rosea]
MDTLVPAIRAAGSRGRIALLTCLQAGVCIAVPAVVAWVSGQPFVFPSLGPTVYLALTAFSTPAASPRNTLAGHLISASAGYLALTATGLTESGPDLSHIDAHRVAAVVIALALTSAGMLLGNVSHPPGGATTLIIALGFLHTPAQLAILMAAVATTTGVLITINRLSGRPYPLWARFRARGEAPPPAPAASPALPVPPVRRSAADVACREAAQALVAAMTTTMWPLAATRAVHLLGRGDPEREARLAVRLATARSAVIGPGPNGRSSIVDQWTAEFRALARDEKVTAITVSMFTDALTSLLVTFTAARNGRPRR